MAEIYVVMTSNCEPYEDYRENINSVWSTREAAIAHIEDVLGMRQVSHATPERKFSRDKWLKETPDLPREEDFDDPQDWLDAHDENGELIPYWVYKTDAWIEVYPLDSLGR